MRSHTRSGLEVILALALFLFSLAALFAGPVRAQVVPLQPNEWVRGEMIDGIRFIGVVQSVDDAGLEVRLRGRTAVTPFRYSAMELLEVQRGLRRSHPQGAVRGLLIGGGIGIVAGALLGGSSSDAYLCDGGCAAEGAVILGVGLGVLGLGVGAILGRSVGDWQVISFPRSRT